METTVNQRIKIFRESVGYDVEALAKALDMHIATVYRLQSEGSPVSKKLLNRLSLQFGVSYDWLVSGAGSMFMGGTEAENIARINSQYNSKNANVNNSIHELLEAERKRADVLERNNNFLLDLLGKLTNGKGLELANFLTAPELKGMVTTLKKVAA